MSIKLINLRLGEKVIEYLDNITKIKELGVGSQAVSYAARLTNELVKIGLML